MWWTLLGCAPLPVPPPEPAAVVESPHSTCSPQMCAAVRFRLQLPPAECGSPPQLLTIHLLDGQLQRAEVHGRVADEGCWHRWVVDGLAEANIAPDGYLGILRVQFGPNGVQPLPAPEPGDGLRCTCVATSVDRKLTWVP